MTDPIDQVEHDRETDILQVSIDSEGRRAWLTVEARKTADRTWSIDDLLSFLRDHGIEHGIVRNRLETVLKHIQKSTETKEDIVVAKATAPEYGEDGSVEYSFDPGLKVGRERGEDQVNYRERDRINNVQEGDLLAIVHERTEGTSGTNVFGDEVSPTPGEPANRPIAASNVRYDKEKKRFYATCF